MTDRRVHSSIDNLPANVRDMLTRMVVDNIFPAGFEPDRTDPKTGDSLPLGRPTYQDMCDYCAMEGYSISLSAMGRFGMQMRTLARMKNAGAIVRDVMKDLTAEKASETQKAVAEMITAQAIEFAASSELDDKQIKNLAKGMRDCTAISISADTYIREQIKTKAETAGKAIEEIAIKKKIDPETLRLIREQVYGIVK